MVAAIEADVPCQALPCPALTCPTLTRRELTFQTSLFGVESPRFDREFATVERTWLDEHSWIEFGAGWLTGADVVFADLADRIAWRQREVVMYDRLLPEPRLTAWWDGGDGSTEALPLLAEMRTAMTNRYSRPFDTIGFNLYRDGRDSVAWHGDRERYTHEDPTVAIVSLGSPRPFQLRPRGGGPSRTYRLGHGDLFVMGGSCQHDWEHGVPKVAHAAGPRLSIMFRHNLAGQPYERRNPPTG